jgi:hypothetical protein
VHLNSAQPVFLVRTFETFVRNFIPNVGLNGTFLLLSFVHFTFALILVLIHSSTHTLSLSLSLSFPLSLSLIRPLISHSNSYGWNFVARIQLGLAERNCTHIHEGLKRILWVIPTASSKLWPILQDYFPHRIIPIDLQQFYLKNLLMIMDYCPILRERILHMIIDKMIQIDVHTLSFSHSLILTLSHVLTLSFSPFTTHTLITFIHILSHSFFLNLNSPFNWNEMFRFRLRSNLMNYPKTTSNPKNPNYLTLKWRKSELKLKKWPINWTWWWTYSYTTSAHVLLLKSTIFMIFSSNVSIGLLFKLTNQNTHNSFSSFFVIWNPHIRKSFWLIYTTNWRVPMKH